MSSSATSAIPQSAGRATFERQGFVLMPAVLEPPLTAFFWSYIHTKFVSRLLTPGDAMVPNTPSDYGDPATDGLLEHLRPRFEEICGRHLLPTYSYFRLYKRRAPGRGRRGRRSPGAPSRPPSCSAAPAS